MKFRFPQLPEAMYDPEPPPILGTWRNVYVTAIAWLAFLIVVLYGFTRYFS
jgi:hypothetical protein